MQIKKAHFIGIGGVGMSATAKLLRESGIAISGSDEEVYPPISTFLDDQKIFYNKHYSPENIPADADVIIIGKNAKLITETNAEVAEAYKSGKRILSFPEVLGELSAGKETVVVAGSYGKSTCAALLAHCLWSAGIDPSFFIGAIPLSPGTSAHIGNGNLFVLEGDEYPSSNTDPRSKFLHLHPSHLLITPLAHDHLNVFPTPLDYLKPFIELLTLPQDHSTVVVCAEGKLNKELILGARRPVITYGVYEGDFHAADITLGEETHFTIVHTESPLVEIATSQLGEHNIQNIVGVAAFLLSQKLVSAYQFKDAVATFRGIKRRLDRKSEETTIPIFEGFGTSHEKAQSAIAAVRRHFPSRRLIIVFEPHTFSWRNKDALPWYDDVFKGAAKVLVYEPASQGANTHKQSSHEEIVDRIRASGIDTFAITQQDQALDILERELQENDCILLLTSGYLGGLIESIPKLAEKKFPKRAA